MNYQDNNMIRFNPGKGSSYRDDSGSMDNKPSGSASSGKDFKKIMEKGEDGGEAALEENLLEAEALATAKAKDTKKPIASLFSLAGTKKASTESELDAEAALAGVHDANDLESPNQLFSTLAANTQQKDTLQYPPHPASTSHTNPHKKVLPHHAPTNTPTHNTATNKSSLADDEIHARYDEDAMIAEREEKQKTTPSAYLSDHPDLTYINPLSTQNLNTTNLTSTQSAIPVGPATDIQAIVDQLVKKLYTVTHASGQVDTTIVLKHPPLLEGATVVVSSFQNAKGEFNISFENLTQQAKYFLDMAANRQSLMDNLQKQGYAVHILTTTTVTENAILVSDTPQSQQNPRDPDDQQQQQRQRQKQDEETA